MMKLKDGSEVASEMTKNLEAGEESPAT